MAENLLSVKNLKTYFRTEAGEAKAVDGVSFDIDRGETLGLVGESGCGKSVTSLSVMRLVPEPPGKTVGGEIRYRGQDLVQISDDDMRKVRGNDIAMIFQEPMTSLNPVFTCGYQIDEAVILHQGLNPTQAREKTVEMLKLVGIPDPEQRANEYPHQLSGGMRQRVMIAMALSCNPDVLIADEPTTALDVTIQAQILELLEKLQTELGMAVLMITHDLGVIAEVADRVAVMYAGKVVEMSEVNRIFKTPRHPYTIGLLESIPKLNEQKETLSVIPGTVPEATRFPVGCRFAPRCSQADDVCLREEPPLLAIEEDEVAGTHQVACWFAEGYSEQMEAEIT
ncbi:MAG TPA: peptide ABC transporter ATP-binding protein [Candidatus Latescibacteria bacterium]|jgi:oligopeptide/dipeptide ABC transporter ATP-binding protein|nr:peptide ABC transporter ATP-binding protein [Candidatus Latescibacterota bacterium]